jgi:hypothetical protein
MCEEKWYYCTMNVKLNLTDFPGGVFLPVPPPAMAERVHKQPEYRLLWAVLQSGIETYMKYAAASSRRGRRLFVEAECWIMQDDDVWVYSFINICNILGLDSSYLRTGLKRWRAQHNPGFKHAA